jgi:hypothetical protein
VVLETDGRLTVIRDHHPASASALRSVKGYSPEDLGPDVRHDVGTEGTGD